MVYSVVRWCFDGLLSAREYSSYLFLLSLTILCASGRGHGSAIGDLEMSDVKVLTAVS